MIIVPSFYTLFLVFYLVNFYSPFKQVVSVSVSKDFFSFIVFVVVFLCLSVGILPENMESDSSVELTPMS